MKVLRFSGLTTVFAVVFSFFGSSVFAQQGTSSASVSRSRAISTTNQPSRVNQTVQTNRSPRRTSYPNSAPASNYDYNYNFVAPDAVAVEEFINYHKHRLPLPKVGQAVALDTRWGSDRVSAAQPEAVLQIGFTTAEVNERADLRPLNLALVIDKSGSMADDDKMSRVKESLRTMIGKLRADDIVSIVAFDTDAEVLLPATRVADGRELRRAVDCLAPDGGTNIHAGLMLGYAEARRYYRENATNRVILLTDGIANVGVTEPGQIAAASAENNGRGLDLSTIGVGLDLDQELLRTLAKSGRGLFHFIGDYQDIEKVFVNELQSLISPVARRVELNVDFDSNLRLEKIYGYAPRVRANGATIPLDDMNSGLTQVVMMKFRTAIGAPVKNSYPVKIRFSYFDIERRRRVEETQEAVLTTGRNKYADILEDVEVKKNFTIAELAQSLFDMKTAAGRGKYREAENIVNYSVGRTYERYPNMEDADIQHVLGIVENYRHDLKNYNRERQPDDCGNCR